MTDRGVMFLRRLFPSRYLFMVPLSKSENESSIILSNFREVLCTSFCCTEYQGRNKDVVPALCSMYKRQFHRVKEYC